MEHVTPHQENDNLYFFVYSFDIFKVSLLQIAFSQDKNLYTRIHLAKCLMKTSLKYILKIPLFLVIMKT